MARDQTKDLDSWKGKRGDNPSQNNYDVDEEEEPNFSDPEDFVDDISDDG